MDNFIKLKSFIPKNWDKGDFVITGSACLATRGVRDVNDLDILVRPHLMLEVVDLHAKGTFPKLKRELLVEHIQEYPRAVLRTGHIDFFESMPRIAYLGVDEVFDRADSCDGYNIISLRHCLAIKALVPRSRSKDVIDMVLLAKLIEKEEIPQRKENSNE